MDAGARCSLDGVVEDHVGHVGRDAKFGHAGLDDATRVVMPAVLDASRVEDLVAGLVDPLREAQYE